MGRRPELAKARKRTELSKVELSAGQAPRDAVGVPRRHRRPGRAATAAALRNLRDHGVSAIATAEAFAPDDASNETRVAAMAAELGLPSCASTDLSGLYGLELRAVTAAINASIMPIALRTASHVEEGVARRRHRRADHGDAGRRRRDRPRRVQGRARAHALLGPRGIGVGRAPVHGRARRHRRRGRRHVDERRGREARAALALLRHRCVPRDGAARRRRAGDRRRRWLDAPGEAGEGLGRRAALGAHRRTSLRLLHRRRAPRGRDAGHDHPPRR